MIAKRNRRADAMWDSMLPALAGLASSQASERKASDALKNVDIVDLGIGYGDFMIKALRHGANYVQGIEKNPDNIHTAINRLRRAGIGAERYRIYEADLSKKSDVNWVFSRSFDAGICTSVLPYLGIYADDLLRAMSVYCGLSIIECQYCGDGPGPAEIKGDEDMSHWLEEHWKSVQKIGSTDLDIRPASRSIWLCSAGKHDD